ncbi:hypothetical protein Zm00014a_023809 [Zea mays]|uniref:Uncharacterized protein n=1 Tax=Zea mays TaxID=4577 RepID=A0A3L6E8N2_MAIZE|nr:hypothetical protein Zm00014a_023809 [Zea mays]
MKMGRRCSCGNNACEPDTSGISSPFKATPKQGPQTIWLIRLAGYRRRPVRPYLVADLGIKDCLNKIITQSFVHVLTL